MKRVACVVLTLSLSACATEGSGDAEQPKTGTKQLDDDKRARDDAKQAPDADQHPPPQPAVEGTVVRVTREQAEAAGLPPLAFRLELADSGMSGGAGNGNYLTFSGPPGGPLVLTISPATVGGDFASLVGGSEPLDATLVDQEVELLGAKRRAVGWITGEGPARTSWCGIIVAPEGADEGDAALLLELGVGHARDNTECQAARHHHVLGPVVESLRFE